MTLTCKFCGQALTPGIGKVMTMRVYRDETGGTCCLNAGSNLTYHHPDSAEFNGGVDYSERTPMGRVGTYQELLWPGFV